MDELLVKYISGEATEQEATEVQQWLQQDVAHGKKLQDLQYIWEQSKLLQAESTVDENDAWIRFQQKLTQKDFQAVSTRNTNFFRPRRIGIAAAALLLIGLSVYLLTTLTAWTVLTAKNDVRIAELPDHSAVTLNKNASLRYNKDFNEQDRKVALKGEAFFDVKRDQQRPFIIKAGKAVITVVGTSFNVKADAAQTEVIVETGLVKVEAEGRESFIKPHEKIVVNNKTGMLSISNSSDSLYRYYRMDRFVCINTPLPELVNALNQHFGSHIVIRNPMLKQLQYNGTFTEDNLDYILQVTSGTLGFKIEKKGDEILLK